MTRVWRVLYKGDRAKTARAMLDRSTDGLVTCGRAGALWRASVDSSAPDGSVLVVQLFPVDPHDIDPTTALYELPMPEGTS